LGRLARSIPHGLFFPGAFFRFLASWLVLGMCFGLASTRVAFGPTSTRAPEMVPIWRLLTGSMTGAGSFLVLPWTWLSVTVASRSPTTLPSVPVTSAVIESLSLLLVIVPPETLMFWKLTFG